MRHPLAQVSRSFPVIAQKQPPIGPLARRRRTFVQLVGEKGIRPWRVIEYDEAPDRREKQHDFSVALV
jgi:hypothetical protein